MPKVAVPVPKVLVVDDEELVRRILVRAFRRVGIETVAASTVEEAILFLDHSITHVVSDINIGRDNGVDLHRYAEEFVHGHGIIYVVMTGLENADERAYFRSKGVRVFDKPQIPFDELLDALGLAEPDENT